MFDLDSEIWLAKRMLDHRGPDVFEGDTNRETRKFRFREAIIACNLEAVVIGAKNGKPIAWPQAFENLYGEPL